MSRFILFLIIISSTLMNSCQEEIRGCQDIQAINYNPEANTGSNYGCDYLEIGDVYQGGVIFYLDSTKVHGLMAAIGDLYGEYQWGCYNDSIIGADLTILNSGIENTEDIINSCEDSLSAAYNTRLIQWEGHTDWYLPSKDELIELYNVASMFSNQYGMQDTYYWTSSEYNDQYSYYVHFRDGYSYINDKNNEYKTRPIRSF